MEIDKRFELARGEVLTRAKSGVSSKKEFLKQKFRTGEFLLHKKFPSSFRTIYRSSLKIDRKDTQIFGDKKIFLVIRRTD